MSREQQIDGMVKIIDQAKHDMWVGECPTYGEHSENIAKYIYNAGYRKQSEGEWVKTETNYTCSKCNFNVVSWSGEYDGYERERGISLMNFCPNCGAKMKGSAE